eukprot:9002642-Alexandrium_andersonii.AAC.1
MKFLWAKIEGGGEFIAWRLISDPDGAAPPLGSDKFGPLPPDLVEPFDGPGTAFPPRPPAEPIASILNTG